jgi:diguanylate cyclase (GGDEF)-like protein/PAS domain S-box-containing protein
MTTKDLKPAGYTSAAQPASEDHFYRLTSTIPQQVWTAKPDGSLDYVSQRVTDYLGCSVEAVLGTGWIDIVHPDDAPEALLRWTRSLATGEDYHIDFRLRRADGVYRWHIARAAALFDANGNIIQWVGTNTDITERKEAEAALAVSEAHLAAAQARALIGSWELDFVANTASASAEWFQIMGRDPSLKLPLADDFNAAIHPQDLIKVRAEHAKALTQKNGSQYDFRIITPEGNIRWIEARLLTFFDAEGTAIRMAGTSQDVSARKHVEIALQESEARLAAAQARAKMGSWRRDMQTQEAEWSQEMYRLFNRNPARKPPSFIDFVRLLHSDDRHAFTQSYTRYIRKGGSYQIDFRVLQPDGQYIWIEARSETVRDANGKVLLLLGTAQDITARKQAELALRTSTQLLELTQTVAKLGGWELDVRTQKLYWTKQVYRLLDTAPDETTPTVEAGLGCFLPESRAQLTQALEHTIHTCEGFDIELKIRTLKGREIDVRLTCEASIENGQPVKLNGIFQDISEQKAAQVALETANAELEYANRILEDIAHYDSLTHLPNRVLLADRMQQAMIHNQRQGQILAVAFLDLDGFKAINDQYGHDSGDRLLITLSHRMKAALREGDTLARIGGDEFVVVLTNLKHTSDCEPMLTRLLEAAAEPVQLGEYWVEVSASIGATLYPQDGVDAEQLLRHADQAMYLAKQAGKNCYHMFDVAQDEAVKTQRESLAHIRAALSNGEFVLYYQPKVNMRTGAIIGAEALIRWQHPERGLLPPTMFLPIIENHLFSIELGEWVIATALDQMAEWQITGLEIPVSVNVGAMQLQQMNFADRLEELLIMQPHADPKHLELEILETSALEDIRQVSATIDACKALGVSFALDDFGTGYASLAYLKRLPAELLKIDQSFVRDMLDDADDLAIIQGIIGLATAFHRQVIAEGVESIAHGKKLLEIGCELGQGYGIARPMPAAAIPNWVKTWHPDNAWFKPD